MHDNRSRDSFARTSVICVWVCMGVCMGVCMSVCMGVRRGGGENRP